MHDYVDLNDFMHMPNLIAMRLINRVYGSGII